MTALESRVAIDAARSAGHLLRSELRGRRRITYKGTPTNLVTEMDARAETLILERLASAFPDDAVLSEETGAHPGRSGRRWIVDPLDGTTNYAHGVPLFAVSIALEGTRDGDPQWEPAEEISRRVARGIADGSVPEGAFLNVNVPALALDQLAGVAITRPAPGGYMHLEERGDGTNERLVREIKPDLRHAHEGTDIRAVVDGYVSVSPLSTALAHPEHAEHLRARASGLFGDLVEP